MTLQELSDAVAAANTNWNGLSAAIRQEFSDKLRARVREAFDDEQRQWLRKWWLRVTEPQVTGANALLPANVRVSARTGLDGLLYVSADLLTDCGPGETYAQFETALKLRTLVRKEDNEWPAPVP